VTPLDIGGLRREFPDRRIDYYPSIDSTMRVAAALEPGAVVLAEEQRAGMGRHGHTWHSEASSGIYCSLVVAPAPVLTLALGLAVQDAIAKSTGIACDLRWPNDVMIADRKVAGILVQLSGAKAIAGIGINVNHQSFPSELAGEATALSRERMRNPRLTGGSACPTVPPECGAGVSACQPRQPIPREPIIAALLHAADEYLAYDTPAILRLFAQASSYAAGRRVEVQQPDGVIRGVTAGLNPEGFLVVRRDDGTDTLIIAGGVRAAGS
jgi:BirA family transcriptional regulator, biotin operon repressor / biotin---[acetyl-CoA-carboxylase] ligase